MKGHVKNKLHPRQLPQGARQLAPSPLGVACLLPLLPEDLLPETRLLLRHGVLAEGVAMLPTTVLLEAQGLQLSLVMRGGIQFHKVLRPDPWDTARSDTLPRP